MASLVPSVLWELTHVTGGSSVLSVKGHVTLGRFLMKEKKANVAPIFKKTKKRVPGSDSPSKPLGRPWNKSSWNPLPDRKKEKVGEICQHRFTNGKSCAAYPTSLM